VIEQDEAPNQSAKPPLSRNAKSGPYVSGVYQIRNVHSGRVYIGRSRTIHTRWLSHLDALTKGVHSNENLQSDWETYGERAFEFIVLEEIDDLDALMQAEGRYLAVAADSYNIKSIPHNQRDVFVNIEASEEGNPATSARFRTDAGEQGPAPRVTSGGYHVLLALARGERHGYGIMREVEALSDGATRLGPGTLYRTLRELLDAGLIAESGERSDPAHDDDERRRYYMLTDLGRSAALAETWRLARLVERARETPGLWALTSLASRLILREGGERDA
jgi:DNA-binding PadR family transcriptional regulator